MVACGTAYYAGAGRQILVRALCAPAGRCRCRLRVPLSRAAAGKRRLPLFISQSGETADTLAALRYCAGHGQAIAAHGQRRRNRPLRAKSQVVFPILCGPEIGVASTKAFTAQLTALATPRHRRRPGARRSERSATSAELVAALVHLPAALGATLETRGADRSTRQAAQARPRTCSISGAARCSRSPWKARSNSRKSPTSTPKAMPAANSSTAPSRWSTRTCR